MLNKKIIIIIYSKKLQTPNFWMPFYAFAVLMGLHFPHYSKCCNFVCVFFKLQIKVCNVVAHLGAGWLASSLRSLAWGISMVKNDRGNHFQGQSSWKCGRALYRDARLSNTTNDFQTTSFVNQLVYLNWFWIVYSDSKLFKCAKWAKRGQNPLR